MLTSYSVATTTFGTVTHGSRSKEYDISLRYMYTSFYFHSPFLDFIAKKSPTTGTMKNSIQSDFKNKTKEWEIVKLGSAK